LSLSNQEVFE